jgi:hypothetical protein
MNINKMIINIAVLLEYGIQISELHYCWHLYAALLLELELRHQLAEHGVKLVEVVHW